MELTTAAHAVVFNSLALWSAYVGLIAPGRVVRFTRSLTGRHRLDSVPPVEHAPERTGGKAPVRAHVQIGHPSIVAVPAAAAAGVHAGRSQPAIRRRFLEAAGARRPVVGLQQQTTGNKDAAMLAYQTRAHGLGWPERWARRRCACSGLTSTSVWWMKQMRVLLE